MHFLDVCYHQNLQKALAKLSIQADVLGITVQRAVSPSQEKSTDYVSFENTTA